MKDTVTMSIERYNELMDMERDRTTFYFYGYGNNMEGETKILRHNKAMQEVLDKNEDIAKSSEEAARKLRGIYSALYSFNGKRFQGKWDRKILNEIKEVLYGKE